MDSTPAGGYSARSASVRRAQSSRGSNNNLPRLTGSAWPGQARLLKEPVVLRRLVLFLPALLLSGPAHAHAILEDSTPPPGGSVRAGAAELRLRFNSRIDHGRSRLTLMRADKSRRTVPIIPGTPPDVVAARIDLVPGAYLLRWQVLAVDGHMTRGDLPFTVTAP